MRRPLYKRWEVKLVNNPKADFGLSISQEPTLISSTSSTASQFDGRKDKERKKKKESEKEKVEAESLNEKQGGVKHTETE